MTQVVPDGGSHGEGLGGAFLRGSITGTLEGTCTTPTPSKQEFISRQGDGYLRCLHPEVLRRKRGRASKPSWPHARQSSQGRGNGKMREETDMNR